MTLPLGIVDLIMKFVIEEITFINVNDDGSEDVRVVRFIDSPYVLNIDEITNI